MTDPRQWVRKCRACGFTCEDGLARSAHRKATRHNDWEVSLVVLIDPVKVAERAAAARKASPARKNRPIKVAPIVPIRETTPDEFIREHVKVVSITGPAPAPPDPPTALPERHFSRSQPSYYDAKKSAECACGRTFKGSKWQDRLAALESHLSWENRPIVDDTWPTLASLFPNVKPSREAKPPRHGAKHERLAKLVATRVEFTPEGEQRLGQGEKMRCPTCFAFGTLTAYNDPIGPVHGCAYCGGAGFVVCDVTKRVRETPNIALPIAGA
jgi:hypothetical protein